MSGTLLRIFRLILAWSVVAVLALWTPPLESFPPGIVGLLFFVVLATILYASFGVLQEASALAKRLGEPYGSLILTLSVVIIEVVLISAVLLGPSPTPTIARDSIYSVMMIILNLVVGAAIVMGSARHGPQRYSRPGARIYLVLITAFGGVTFLGPRLFPSGEGAFPPWVGAIVAVIIAGSYAAFLVLQMGTWKRLFIQQPTSTSRPVPSTITPRERRSEALDGSWVRFAILVALLVAISLLAEDLALFIDFGIDYLGLPVALGGLTIAAIVFTPETLTTWRAALSNEMQRVVNLCLGAFVSTVGLTVPSVLVISALTGRQAVFALSAIDTWLFLATVGLTWFTYTRRFTTGALGWLHLGLFAGFAVMTLIQ